MKGLMKEFLVTIAITIGLTIATIISFHFNFRFVAGFICFPTLLLYYAVFMVGKDLYQTYKDEKERIRKDEEWRRKRLVEEIME